MKNKPEINNVVDDFFNKLDFFNESKKDEIQLINWLIAIAAGLLVMTISNIDKFLHEGHIFLKPFFIVVIVILGYSLSSLGILRFLHFLSAYGLSTMRSSIKKRRWRIEQNIGDKKENEDKIMDRINGWVKSSNLVGDRSRWLIVSFISLFISILLYVVYFIFLIIFKL